MYENPNRRRNRKPKATHTTNTQITRDARNIEGLRGAGTEKATYHPGRKFKSKTRQPTTGNTKPESKGEKSSLKYFVVLLVLGVVAFLSSCTSTKLPKQIFNAGVDSTVAKLEQATPKFKLKFEKDENGFYHFAGSESPKPKPTSDIVSTILKHNPELLVKANILPTTDSTIRAELFLNYDYLAELFKSGIHKVIDDKQSNTAKELRDLQKIAASTVIDSLLYKLESRTPKLEIEFKKDSSAKSVSYHYAKDRNGLVRGFVSTNTSNASLVCVEPFLNYQFIVDWVKQEGGKIIDKANTELKAWVDKKFPKKSKSENATGSTKKLPDPGRK